MTESTLEVGKRASGMNVNREEISHSLSCSHILIRERNQVSQSQALFSPSFLTLVNSHTLRILVRLSRSC